MAIEDRERKLSEIYHAALQSDPGQRAEFVRFACGEDTDLRSEIESLLGWERKAGSFLETAAVEGFGGKSGEDNGRSLIGATLGPYHVISLLGAGGMGEVYAARDTRLGRTVALKVLAPFLAEDPRFKRRLLEEAKAGSALNHPGIVTLHDVGSENGIDYLVMEYVPGTTLDKLIPPAGLELRKALRFAIEIAGAVSAAHTAGIIHRDLKPGNIMIGDAGEAKVLDFGLARLNEPVTPEDRTAGAETSVLAGTVAYMSPEQARRKAVDARSDLFSFGIVLYEMLAGRHPFRRGDRAATLKAILEEEPARLTGIPGGLEKLVTRCLRKDPGDRFQHMSEAKAALENVKRRKRSRLAVSLGIAACISAALAGVLLYRTDAPQLPSNSNWVALTDFADSATQPAVSPDGRTLAFIRGPSGFMSPGQIYVKSMPDGEPIQLTDDSTVKMGPVFSPDGSELAYSVHPSWDSWIVPVQSREPRLMLKNASGLTWIDPAHLLFSEIKTGRHMAIVTATRSKTEARDVYLPPGPNGMAHRSYISPDRKWVLVVEMETSRKSAWLPCRFVPFD